MAVNTTSKSLTFVVERETKRMVRFNERVQAGEEPTIGTLYVSKAYLKTIGALSNIVVTITPAPVS